MKEFKLLLTFLLLSFLFFNSINGQQRFKAGVVAGLNASQILGDEVGGYNKAGLQAGLRAISVLTDKTDLIFEILYSQRGSRASNNQGGGLKISLDYVEVPVVLTFKDWLTEDDYYKIQVSGGFSYSRLINASAIDTFHDDETENFNSNDYGFTVGAEFFASEILSIGVRWSRSMNLLFSNKNNENLNSLRGYFLSFRTAYIF